MLHVLVHGMSVLHIACLNTKVVDPRRHKCQRIIYDKLSESFPKLPNIMNINIRLTGARHSAARERLFFVLHVYMNLFVERRARDELRIVICDIFIYLFSKH